MSVPVIKALTKRIRKRIGSSELAAMACGLSNKGAWSLYESENHPDTTLPLHRFLECANDAEKQALIDLIRLAMEGDDVPECANTEASETTEAAADLQRAVREALRDGTLTPMERRTITEQAMTVKANADDVIQAVHGGEMTPKQAECLAVIKRMTFNGVPPSYEEIMREMGLTSKAPVHRMIHALKDRGVIAMSPDKARTITVRDEHAEAIPFDLMAEAVADLIARGRRVYPAQIRKVLVQTYAGAAQ